MPAEPVRAGGALHARLEQIESGLFRAEYGGEINAENTDARQIPDVHIATSAEDVKTWVEQMALNLGYDRVVWDKLPGD